MTCWFVVAAETPDGSFHKSLRKRLPYASAYASAYASSAKR